MPEELSELDAMQSAYKEAVDGWVTLIRQEESLASDAGHSVASIDGWEEAAGRENEARNKAKDAKKTYENALREKFFHF
jgi:hypothetical protein